MADNNTILEKLEGLVARFEEVSTLITDPAVIADQKRYVKLTKEYKELGDLMKARKEYMQVLSGIEVQNYYIAASKHVMYRRNEFGFHLTYRYFTSDFNAKWRGIAAGITYRPSFARNLRATIEYTGDDINIGADCLLWKHLFLQATLQNGKHFTGGLCFKLNLLGKTHPD